MFSNDILLDASVQEALSEKEIREVWVGKVFASVLPSQITEPKSCHKEFRPDFTIIIGNSSLRYSTLV